jgi:hypothetical protein
VIFSEDYCFANKACYVCRACIVYAVIGDCGNKCVCYAVNELNYSVYGYVLILYARNEAAPCYEGIYSKLYYGFNIFYKLCSDYAFLYKNAEYVVNCCACICYGYVREVKYVLKCYFAFCKIEELIEAGVYPRNLWE